MQPQHLYNFIFTHHFGGEAARFRQNCSPFFSLRAWNCFRFRGWEELDVSTSCFLGMNYTLLISSFSNKLTAPNVKWRHFGDHLWLRPLLSPSLRKQGYREAWPPPLAGMAENCPGFTFCERTDFMTSLASGLGMEDRKRQRGSSFSWATHSQLPEPNYLCLFGQAGEPLQLRSGETCSK